MFGLKKEIERVIKRTGIDYICRESLYHQTKESFDDVYSRISELENKIDALASYFGLEIDRVAFNGYEANKIKKEKK
jgi:hypothetical protein